MMKKHILAILLFGSFCQGGEITLNFSDSSKWFLRRFAATYPTTTVAPIIGGSKEITLSKATVEDRGRAPKQVKRRRGGQVARTTPANLTLSFAAVESQRESRLSKGLKISKKGVDVKLTLEQVEEPVYKLARDDKLLDVFDLKTSLQSSERAKLTSLPAVFAALRSLGYKMFLTQKYKGEVGAGFGEIEFSASHALEAASSFWQQLLCFKVSYPVKGEFLKIVCASFSNESFKLVLGKMEEREVQDIKGRYILMEEGRKPKLQEMRKFMGFCDLVLPVKDEITTTKEMEDIAVFSQDGVLGQIRVNERYPFVSISPITGSMFNSDLFLYITSKENPSGEGFVADKVYILSKFLRLMEPSSRSCQCSREALMFPDMSFERDSIRIKNIEPADISNSVLRDLLMLRDRELVPMAFRRIESHTDYNFSAATLNALESVEDERVSGVIGSFLTEYYSKYLRQLAKLKLLNINSLFATVLASETTDADTWISYLLGMVSSYTIDAFMLLVSNVLSALGLAVSVACSMAKEVWNVFKQGGVLLYDGIECLINLIKRGVVGSEGKAGTLGAASDGLAQDVSEAGPLFRGLSVSDEPATIFERSERSIEDNLKLCEQITQSIGLIQVRQVTTEREKQNRKVIIEAFARFYRCIHKDRLIDTAAPALKEVFACLSKYTFDCNTIDCNTIFEFADSDDRIDAGKLKETMKNLGGDAFTLASKNNGVFVFLYIALCFYHLESFDDKGGQDIKALNLAATEIISNISSSADDDNCDLKAICNSVLFKPGERVLNEQERAELCREIDEGRCELDITKEDVQAGRVIFSDDVLTKKSTASPGDLGGYKLIMTEDDIMKVVQLLV